MGLARQVKVGLSHTRHTDEPEQFPIPFGVDTRMQVVHRPGWNLYSRLGRDRIEIEQAVRPTGRPGLQSACAGYAAQRTRLWVLRQ